MKKDKIKFVAGLGIACVLFAIASSWYAIHYNESRLVVPMDFSEYVFQVKDLPMICSITLLCLYVLFLFALMVKASIKNGRTVKNTQTTRKLNPKLGFLGFAGFLGFSGFWTYSVDQSVSPFIFFTFFGFFGFFFEGKMSNTLIDERYKENAMKAQLTALKTAFTVIVIALIVLCQGKLFGNLEYTLIAMIILLALTIGLTMFLSEYLLYRYDHDDQLDESEE